MLADCHPVLGIERDLEESALIGLLTPYKISNFGTKLQAYAVQQVMGTFGKTEIIDYRPTLVDRVVHKPESMRNARYLDFDHNKADDAGIRELLESRKRAIDDFDRQLVRSEPIEGRLKLKRHARSYTAVVCGSDQIWNPVNLNRHIYMLEFAHPTTRRIAFSPSFGIESIPNALKQTYKRRLSHLDFISVRERSGLDILSDLGFHDALWTLDPTLVMDGVAWKALEKRPDGLDTLSMPFLFCYFLGSRDQERTIARAIAREHGLQLVTIPHFKGCITSDEDFGDIQLGAISVQSFLWLIHHATAVCTDSFHASSFAIQFQRDLYCCPRHESDAVAATNSRVTSLYEGLGLGHRIVHSVEQALEIANQHIDYEAAFDTLEDMRRSTWGYLRLSMEGVS